MAYYASRKGIDPSEVSTLDDDFIAFTFELFKMEDGGWHLTEAMWSHTYSGNAGILYDSGQEAVDSLYTDDVFCAQPKPPKLNM